PGNARCSGLSLECVCLWDQNASSRVEAQSTKRKPDFIRTANNGSFHTTKGANSPENFHGVPSHTVRSTGVQERRCTHNLRGISHSVQFIALPPISLRRSIRNRLSILAISCSLCGKAPSSSHQQLPPDVP